MDLSHVTAFFLLRKKATGGFGASPRLPATIEDTYYALRSMKALVENGFKVPSHVFSGHDVFLLAKLKETDLSCRSRFQILWCLWSLDVDVPPMALMGLKKIKKRGLGLEDAFYLRRMGLLSHDNINTSRFERAIKTVRDLRMFLCCVRGAPRRDRWLEWLSRCQNQDGGLGFMPGTTSFTENCYYGLRTAKLLGEIPFDLEALHSFILSTKSGRGGFGRRNLGVPFPSSTWHAVGTLLNKSVYGYGPQGMRF